MKKITLTVFAAAAIASALLFFAYEKSETSEKSRIIASNDQAALNLKPSPYKFPSFYRGIYLTQPSGKDPVRLAKFIEEARQSSINTFVVDVQPAKNNTCSIQAENVKMMIDAGIHPIARIVCFQDGLRSWPVPKDKIDSFIEIAVSAAENGFKEIQFDYIRFEDSGALKKLSIPQRYAFVESILGRAKESLKKYNVKTAADIFGRIPLYGNDIIGQNMESLDKVVDNICPMAYPSHYTWSTKMMKDPYFTVFTTAKSGKDRIKSAEIVTWIQAFDIKVKYSGLTYAKYIEEQVKAVHDANVRGYLFWNARQVYVVPFKVLQDYYKDKNVETGKVKPVN
jgi:hypothetical protein